MADIDNESGPNQIVYVSYTRHYAQMNGLASQTKEEIVREANLALLSRIKEEVPEYWPNCEKYPDSMGTYCNNCRWCKNRNRDDLVTGYEWANDDLKAKLDNIAKEIRGEQ